MFVNLYFGSFSSIDIIPLLKKNLRDSISIDSNMSESKWYIYIQSCMSDSQSDISDSQSDMSDSQSGMSDSQSDMSDSQSGMSDLQSDMSDSQSGMSDS